MYNISKSMQREIYTILYQLQLDESSVIISKLQPYYIVKHLRCENTNKEIMKRAVLNGYIEIVQLMLEHGADNINDAIEWSANRGHIDIVKLLLEYGATNLNYAIYYAAIYGHIDIVQLMLDLGATEINGAMCSAAYSGRIEIVRLLLDNGADDYNSAMCGLSLIHI